MLLLRGTRAVGTQWRFAQRPSQLATVTVAAAMASRRGFHVSSPLRVVKPVLLADIGEGIVECEIIQWFVEPGARVEEFSPLCEVQSDKASVEITSRFSGVVKKLYYEAGEMARVGKPFVDIDIQGSARKGDLEALTPPEPEPEAAEKERTPQETTPPEPTPQEEVRAQQPHPEPASGENGHGNVNGNGKFATLATPAVRHLSKEMNIDISQISGTGRDGRVLKEDIHNFVQNRTARPSAQPAPYPTHATEQQEKPVQLTNTQLQMFKAMTRSLTIPHFLYADEVDFSSLCELRARLNKVLSVSAREGEVAKLSYLPFIIKAVSMALYQYPILNARVDMDPQTSKPTLVMRSQHNIGVAMDTPSGLIVPVIRDVGSLNIVSIAAELSRLQSQALAGKLTPQDLSGGTITVSNIGNIGGTYLSPVIVEREVAILGIGRMRTVPAFDDADHVVRKQVCNFSWSADHRVVDGATMARAADVVRRVVEEPDVMVMHLR